MSVAISSTLTQCGVCYKNNGMRTTIAIGAAWTIMMAFGRTGILI